MHLKKTNYKRLVNFIKNLYETTPTFTRKIIDQFYTRRIDQSIYIKELSCIYIPVPKVATKSIKKTFADYYYKIQSDQRFNTKSKKKWGLPFQKISKRKVLTLSDSVFVFSFVRNPYDRILSCYLDKIKTNSNYLGFLRYGDRFYKEMSFEDFLEEINKIPDSKADKHFRSQYRFLKKSEEFIPDFIGKLNSISTSFQKILDEIGMDQMEIVHINKSKPQEKSNQYFTQKAKKLIWERYKEDFLYFEYPKNR